MDWQLIATAPKDGTSILALETVGIIPGPVYYVAWWSDNFPIGGGWNGGFEFGDLTPTHWLPIPEPPV